MLLSSGCLVSSFLSCLSACALIQTILDNEDEVFRRDVDYRLGLVKLELSDLKSMQQALTSLLQSGTKQAGYYSDQLDFPEEFAAFFSWLLCGRAFHGDSHEFDLLVNKNIAQLCEAMGLDLAEHRLKIVGWVVGRENSGSLTGFPASLPSKASGIPELAVLAFHGLLEHQTYLVDSMKSGIRAVENEMNISSLPIRIAGLAEALIQSGGEGKKLPAVMGIVHQQTKIIFPQKLQSRWSYDEIQSLIKDRNAAAHVWDDGSGGPTLKGLIDKLTAEYASSLFELATYLVAGTISLRLKNLELIKAEQWLKVINRNIGQMEVIYL